MSPNSMIGAGGVALLAIDARDLMLGDITQCGATVVSVVKHGGKVYVDFIGAPFRVMGCNDRLIIRDDRF